MRIYKPYQENKGAASQWQLSFKKDKKFDNVMFFLTLTKQTGVDDDKNSTFGWLDPTKTVTAKLGELDLGEILCVLNGIKEHAGNGDKGLFHKNLKGNTIINFTRAFKDGVFQGYYLKASKKNAGDKEALQIQHTVSIAEGEVIRVLLQNAIEAMYGW